MAAVLPVACGWVGLDFERLDRIRDLCVPYFAHIDEARSAARQALGPELPTVLWAVKEAAFKSLTGHQHVAHLAEVVVRFTQPNCFVFWHRDREELTGRGGYTRLDQYALAAAVIGAWTCQKPRKAWEDEHQ